MRLHATTIAMWLGLAVYPGAWQAGETPSPAVPPSDTQAKTPVSYRELVDITESTGIHFEHVSSPEQKSIVESMSAGVTLIDYDGDGFPDIYFTNAQTAEMALHAQKTRSALYHNNGDGTFTDVTDKAGVAYPCWAMGAVVGDYNNDGWPDLLVTCFGGLVMYRNNKDGTFSDVTKAMGLANDKMWATGAAFGDYDNDGFDDLFVSHYVEVDLNHLKALGSSEFCKYLGIDVQCGPFPAPLTRDSTDQHGAKATAFNWPPVSHRSSIPNAGHRVFTGRGDLCSLSGSSWPFLSSSIFCLIEAPF
jgi:hypothetical protein